MIDPERREQLYGPYAANMDPDSKYFADIRDRAAFTYITGTDPSHLRKEYTRALKYFTRLYAKPSSMDGRIGSEYLDPNIVTDLGLDAHPMVIKARRYIARGYLLQGSRGFGARRSFQNVYLFKLGPDQTMTDRVTVRIDGAVNEGWGEGF